MPDDTESPSTESTDTPDEQGHKAARRPSKAPSKSPRALIAVAAVLVLVIVALAGVWWYRESSHSSQSSSSFSDQEVADAKKAVCEASARAQRGMVLNTHLQNPSPDDRAGALAVMANARLALTAGGSYLHDFLEAHPATAQDLTDAVRSWSISLETLGISYLAGEPNEARKSLHEELGTEFKKVGELCK